MKANTIPEDWWPRLSETIAEKMGLDFSPARRADLLRGLTNAAEELGFADAAECADWLLSSSPGKAQMHVLASHLTVGETYFFRERKTFDALRTQVLPGIVRNRRESGLRLRIWSAACCSGEEAYSLAILLREVIPDLANWHVTILATDINDQFLKKGAAGVYSRWSFRETPPEFRDRYFTQTPDGRFAILPEIKEQVTFAHLNLVEDVFPALATDTNAMDLLLCRNVLMYFTEPQVRKVVANLHRSIVDGGWLVVSPSEVSQRLFPMFKPANFPGAILYRKYRPNERHEPIWEPPPLEPAIPLASLVPLPIAQPLPEIVDAPLPVDIAARLYDEGRYSDAAQALLSAPPSTSAEFSLLSRALANHGELAEALKWCDRWLAEDKLDASGHYLRAVVLQELGDREDATRSLQRAIYLRPELVLAHFALGNLSRAEGRIPEADKHFTNALRQLRKLPPDESLPESDGLTAERLTEIVLSLLSVEAVHE